MRHWRFREASVSLVFSCVSLLLLCGVAQALPSYGPLEISGNISAQNLIRTPDAETYSLVQQRNTLKLRVDYSLLQGDTSNLPAPFSYLTAVANQGRLFLLYRGVYDSFYDLAPGVVPTKDMYGQPAPRLDQMGIGNRNSAKFQDYNNIREAYIDLGLKQIPLSLRLGRQQIVWGETDSFRLLDRVNALDLSWRLQQESWDEIRIPYWMIKGIFDFDKYGWFTPLSNAFMEFYWNPGDWNPNKRVFLPNPWSAPISDPLAKLVTKLKPLGYSNITEKLYNGTTLFNQGDYVRNPIENSQAGVRVSAVTPQGVQFTLNYFYQRWNGGDDGCNTASEKGILNKAEALAALRGGELPIEAIDPYVHTVGGSLNYADEEYTQAVFRAETIYELGVPFTDASKNYLKTSPFNYLLGADVYGVSKRDMWNGMIGFDRPTWIRPLNRNTTFLILGQFFWQYLIDNPSIRWTPVGSGSRASMLPGGTNNPQTHGFRGEFSGSEQLTGGDPVIDKVRDWELLATLAATTFYRGGKLVPFLVYIIDPVNSYNMEAIWMFDYYITNNVILNLRQTYFINTVSHPVYESWGVGGVNRGRSETGLRLTYQF